MSNKKPRVFVGSSTEQRRIAKAVRANLEEVAHVEVWDKVFKLTTAVIDNLLEQLADADFGVFILAPEDTSQIREETVSVARDNVIFEVGLSMGNLGKERTILVVPEEDDIKLRIPVDLAGLTYATFDAERARQGPQQAMSALGTACDRIEQRLQDLGPIEDEERPYKGINTRLLGQWRCTWLASGPVRPSGEPPSGDVTLEEEETIEDIAIVSRVTEYSLRGRGENENKGVIDIQGRIHQANFVTLIWEPEPLAGRDQTILRGGVAILELNKARNKMSGFWYEFDDEGEFFGGDVTWVHE